VLELGVSEWGIVGGDALMSDEGEREGMGEHSAGSLFFWRKCI
jgi:hypothetical protein